MPKKIRIIHYGLGPIGISIACLLLKKSNVEIVGAIDVDPAKVGKDLGEVIGIEQDLRISVSDQAAHVLETAADLVIHSTSSYLPQVDMQLLQCIEAGCSVLSTCEELSYPFQKHPHISERLDQAAHRQGVTVLGTGINPGFLMDKLVLTLTAVCQKVHTVEVTRIVDAGQRRLPLQQKIGAGLTPDEFATLVTAGKIKHHGLPESVAMIADTLDLGIDEIRETIDPVITPVPLQTNFISIPAGHVAGVRQTAYGATADHHKIRLQLQMSVRADNPVDEVRISGTPDLHCQFPGGVHGDIATAAVVVNCTPLVLKARPGLLTSRDIPMHYFAGLGE